MNEDLDEKERATAKLARELTALREQTEEARAALARLRQDVAETVGLPAAQAQLVEANAHLVVATLRAQAETETAARALKEVARSAELDALTGLPNRLLMFDRLERAIASAKRHDARLALLFLDIDKFKQINDTLGHAAGDDVLRLVARCLVSSIRGADTVSRHGGDEFLVLVTEMSQTSDVVLVVEKVIAALDAESWAGDHGQRVTASIGISIYPDDGEDAKALIDCADAAMYRAKRLGLGNYAFHCEHAMSGPNPKPGTLASAVDGPERRHGVRDRRGRNRGAERGGASPRTARTP
jgi:diguanylate cyclase (GGDEF)-like protein